MRSVEDNRERQGGVTVERLSHIQNKANARVLDVGCWALNVSGGCLWREWWVEDGEECWLAGFAQAEPSEDMGVECRALDASGGSVM